jgi:hypothetical protein
MENPQDIDILQRLDILGKKIALLEKVSSEILTSLHHLTEHTKDACVQLQEMQPAPAQNTLLKLQETPETEPVNVEPIQEKTSTNELANEDTKEPPEENSKAPEVPEVPTA